MELPLVLGFGWFIWRNAKLKSDKINKKLTPGPYGSFREDTSRVDLGLNEAVHPELLKVNQEAEIIYTPQFTQTYEDFQRLRRSRYKVGKMDPFKKYSGTRIHGLKAQFIGVPYMASDHSTMTISHADRGIIKESYNAPNIKYNYRNYRSGNNQ